MNLLHFRRDGIFTFMIHPPHPGKMLKLSVDFVDAGIYGRESDIEHGVQVRAVTYRLTPFT